MKKKIISLLMTTILISSLITGCGSNTENNRNTDEVQTEAVKETEGMVHLETADEVTAFFDELYSKYSIERVWASRNINANPKKRGQLTEILVHNYNIEQTNYKNKTTDILSVAEDSIRYGKRF